MERIFKYAILRLIPEAYRGEQLNIGVVVFTDGQLDVRLYIQPRVAKLFGLDPHNLEWTREAIQGADRAEESAEERHSLLSTFPGLGLSELGWFAAETNVEYELRLDRIRSDYIDRPKLVVTQVRRTRLTRQLRDEFQSRRIMGRHREDLERHKVVANVAVGPSNKLNVDFLAKNKSFHATETVDFSRSNDTGAFELKEAALAAYTLRYAKKELGPRNTRCYFVYLAPAVVERSIAPALSMVEGDVDMLFNLTSDDDKRRYLEIMMSALESPSLFNSDVSIGRSAN